MAIPVANSSITSLSPGVAWEATIRPPLSPTSLLLLTVARAAAGKAAWPQGLRRRGFGLRSSHRQRPGEGGGGLLGDGRRKTDPHRSAGPSGEVVGGWVVCWGGGVWWG
jgi:hypothetical protein